MSANVHIEAREHGKLVAARDVHNTWTPAGSLWLAKLVGLLTVDPDVPEMIYRIKTMGFGIGGGRQSSQGMVTSSPLSAIFPVTSLPHATSGFTFNDDYPPGITTLEMPVPLVGAPIGDAYANPAGLTWRGWGTSSGDAHPYGHPGRGTWSFRFTARKPTPFVWPSPISSGQYAFLPLSEVALYTSDVSETDSPFAAPVGYALFDTIQIGEETDFFVEWQVTF